MEKPRSKSPLDHALSLVAPVNAGEGLAAVLLMVAVFIILSAYYVLKTTREGLLVSGGTFGLSPDELKIYAGGAMAMLMLVIVPAYGNLASRVPRKRLLDWSYAIVIACLAIFFLLGNAELPVGVPFFIWLGIINMFLIAQFWSFANDLYTEEQGKRLFAIIAIGGSAGAIVGPKLTKISKDPYTMLGIAGAMLLVTIVILGLVDKLAQKNKGEAAKASAPLGKDGGFQLVLRERYLLLIGVMLFLANLVNTTGEYILANAAYSHASELHPDSAFAHIADENARSAAIAAARGPAQKEFFADFYFYVNLVGFLIQTLLTSRIIKYAGIRLALFVFPLVALGSYASIGLIGGLTLITIAKVAENSTDYSLQNTVRQSLFLPTSREVKYKAKAAIDTFFVRFGDTAAALLVLLGVQVLGWGANVFAFVVTGVIVVWLLVAFGISQRYKALESKTAEKKPD
jgi:ATP:ADP antiporter, AAA family